MAKGLLDPTAIRELASQLALLFVRRLKVPVVLTDLDAERVTRGVGYVHAEIDGLRANGRLSADKANRYRALVTGAVEKADVFADADFDKAANSVRVHATYLRRALKPTEGLVVLTDGRYRLAIDADAIDE